MLDMETGMTLYLGVHALQGDGLGIASKDRRAGREREVAPVIETVPYSTISSVHALTLQTLAYHCGGSLPPPSALSNVFVMSWSGNVLLSTCS